ncbi:MAG: glycosyltransferase family 2 protein [Acidobacteriota bacterium]
MTALEPETLLSLREAPPSGLVQPLEVSYAVVTWNSGRWIERCLRAIPAASPGVTYQVLICDNASADDTLERVDHFLSDTVEHEAGQAAIEHVVIRRAGNDGFAAGINRLATLSPARYLFLLNPDCELSPEALTRLRDFLDAHPDVAAAAPLLTHENGDDQREFQLRKLPTLRSLALEVLLHRSTDRYPRLDLTNPQPIEQPAAAALLIRREVFEELGALDEQFAPAWFEDVDFCRRLARAGKLVYVVPAAGARHFGGASLEHMTFEQFTDIWYHNMWRYAVKWMSSGQAETLRWVLIAGMLMRCGAALAGAAHPEVGRWAALRAYAAVLGKAFHRWESR